MKEIVDWFRTYEHETMAGELPDKRRMLAIANYDNAKQIRQLEIGHKRAYAERKIVEETEPLKFEGTVQERTGKAMGVIKRYRLKEAELEGKLRGCRIMYDAAGEVLNAMSTYIKLMQ